MTKNNKSMQDLNKKSKKKVNLDKSLPIVLVNIFKEGDIFTKLSFLIMGFSNIVRGQIIKGILFLATQLSFIYFMLMNEGGLFRLKGLTTLTAPNACSPKIFPTTIVSEITSKNCMTTVTAPVNSNERNCLLQKVFLIMHSSQIKYFVLLQ